MPSTRDEAIDHFYIVAGIYLFLIFCVAIYGFLKGRKAGKEGNEAALHHHFLGGRSFGFMFLFLTIYSTIWSGYVVVGIPDEAKGAGYFSFRWFFFAFNVTASIIIMVPQLRRINVTRDYMSVYEFIADRFNSRTLRVLLSLFGSAGSFMFVIVEFKALGDTIVEITDGQISQEAGVLFLAGFIFMCEFLGGMTTIASTDAIQTAVMVISFLVLPFIIADQYGGFDAITGPGCDKTTYTAYHPLAMANYPPDTDPAALGAIHSDDPADPIFTPGVYFPWASGCLGYQASALAVGKPPNFDLDTVPFYAGDLGLTQLWGGMMQCQATEGCSNEEAFAPYYAGGIHEAYEAGGEQYFEFAAFENKIVRYPSTFSMFAFGMTGLSLAFNPHWIQRVMIAKSDYAWKLALLMMMTTAWFSFPPVILVGMTSLAHFPWEADGSAFGVVTGDLMVQGYGYEVCCIILLCSALAAFMSTADSTVIGIVNVICVDVTKGSIFPSISDNATLYLSKVASFCILLAAALISFDDSLDDHWAYEELIDWLLALLWVTVPSWVYGLFTDYVKSRALICGICVNVIYLFTVAFTSYAEESTTAGGQKEMDGAMRFIGLGLWPGLANFVVCPIAQFILEKIDEGFSTDFHTERPMLFGLYNDAVEEKFWTTPERRDGFLKWETVDKITGYGQQNPLSKPLGKVLFFLAFVIAILCLPWYQSEFDMDFEKVAGMPDWAFTMLMGCLGGFLCLYVVVFMWDAQKESDEVDYKHRSEVRMSEVAGRSEVRMSEVGGKRDPATSISGAYNQNTAV